MIDFKKMLREDMDAEFWQLIGNSRKDEFDTEHSPRYEFNYDY